MANEIMCRVENCQYWNSQNCTASAIEVDVDDGGHNASYTRDTNCHTFKSKNKKSCGRARD